MIRDGQLLGIGKKWSWLMLKYRNLHGGTVENQKTPSQGS